MVTGLFSGNVFILDNNRKQLNALSSLELRSDPFLKRVNSKNPHTLQWEQMGTSPWQVGIESFSLLIYILSTLKDLGLRREKTFFSDDLE